MKVAKVKVGEHKEKWLVHDVDRGWVGPAGETIQPQASGRHTKFYKGLTEAKIDGFSPTAEHAKVIAKWATPAAATPEQKAK